MDKQEIALEREKILVLLPYHILGTSRKFIPVLCIHMYYLLKGLYWEF